MIPVEADQTCCVCGKSSVRPVSHWECERGLMDSLDRAIPAETVSKPLVWKHDCIRHGMVDANGEGPCSPPCDEPWQVDAPLPTSGGTFPTFAEAIAYATANKEMLCGEPDAR